MSNQNSNKTVHPERYLEIKTSLVAIFKSVLGLQPTELAEAETFQELGISSINAVELLEAINTEFNLSLASSIVFEFNSFAALANYLGEMIAAHPSPSASPQHQKGSVIREASSGEPDQNRPDAMRELDDFYGKNPRSAPEAISEKLVGIFAAVLKLEHAELAEAETLQELGISSINAVELLEAINTEFNLNLASSIVFEFNSFDALANYLGEVLAAHHCSSAISQPQKGSALREASSGEPDQNRPDAMRELDDFDGKNPRSAPEAISEKLVAIFAAVLKLERAELAEAETLQELGIGSINAVELLEAVNTEFNLSLASSIVFEFNSFAALANYVAATQEGCSIAQEPFAAESRETLIDKPSSEAKYQARDFETVEPKVADPIAIIGLACRCAGASGPDQFWENISQGADSIQETKNPNWLHYFALHSPTKAPTRYGIMEDIECFDPLFFKISPKEAQAMDVSQRILLEECYKALEDAGYTASLLRGRPVGTFIGTMGIAPLKQDFSHLALLGSDSSILSSRIAYYLDLKGPAITINTACSSSLVAIDIACQKLQNNEINLAIAGGITIHTNPGAFIAMNNAGMLSPSGECRPFDNQADGIVVGDGSGVVILKRLSEARRDHDHIYGIIRGGGTNQDGQTSGITAPSFLSQSQLEATIYEKNQIAAEDIQYIETHGTATKLGDPIEIHALTHAFQKFTSQKRFCAIGSLKANIGHTTAASGVLSLIKVLLSLKHQQMPPTIHFNQENEHIDFANSPFYVNTTLNEWPVNTRNTRLAAISSFGFSGTNAHLVVEADRAEDFKRSALPATQDPVLILLSAKTADQLQAQACQLLDWIVKRRLTAHNLVDVAYTLQVGREALEERLALMVSSVKELVDKLQGFVSGKEGQNGVYRGQVKPHKEALAIFAGDEELQGAVDQWIHRRKYWKLLAGWVKGLLFDWNKLYPEHRPVRISLPTYPFAKERFQLPEIVAISDNLASLTVGRMLHPLVHQNTSDFAEQRFTSSFSGQEFFLADHRVQDQRMMPGVAYLEMARAAVKEATESSKDGQDVIQLKNVVWIQPFMAEDPAVQLNIGLYPEANGEIAYEIYSDAATHDSESIVYSRGSAVVGALAEKATLDLKSLQEQCSHGTVSSAQCYEAFKAMGIGYGQGHQGIEQIYLGENQVLAKLSLPATVANTLNQFVLHPSMMDSAMQASLGLLWDLKDPPDVNNLVALKPVVPFALQELEIFNACQSAMWALVRFSNSENGRTYNSRQITKFDVDLCDEQGQVCVRIKEFSARVMEEERGLIKTPLRQETNPFGTLMLEPVWQEQPIVHNSTKPAYGQYLVILCEVEEISREKLETSCNGFAPVGRCLILKPGMGEGITKRFTAYAVRIFEEIQRLGASSKNRLLIQVVVPAQVDQQLFTGIAGLLQTAHHENPNLFGQLIQVEAGETTESLAAKLKENSLNPVDVRICYRNGKRWVQGWNQVEVGMAEDGIPWKDGGIYLITGGAGGLGLIFAQEIVGRVKAVTLILTGRSGLNEAQQARIRKLEASGARIAYRQVDVTEQSAVTDLIANIQKEFGGLHGIIHSAGVIRDNYISKKSGAEFQEVLAPKVTGLVNLDLATQDLPLDFLICFSSLAGWAGNSGQADYATANAFMDAYAKYRNALVATHQRQGRTISINWPLWQEGGMSIDQATEKRMTETTGMRPLKTDSGIDAFYRSFALGKEQLIVMQGDLARIKQMLLAAAEGERRPFQNEFAADLAKEAVDALPQKAVHYLKKLLSAVINLPVQQIEADAPLEKYGIDSIMVLQMTDELEKTFGPLSKTLFFEYQNLQDLSGYLVQTYREQLFKLLGMEVKAVSHLESARVSQPTEPTIKSRAGQHRRSRWPGAQSPIPRSAKSSEALDIAIIGVAGRYPQAENLREFWKNLRDGKDCITEIPKERWDHSRYFDADKNRLGKTYSKWGGFLNGVDQFDPLFFNISPREAEFLDPQERIFLECVYETLEDAGYTREKLGDYQQLGLEGNVGVYVGVMYEEYQLYGAQEQLQGRPVALSGSPSGIANRVSYFCNFHGPSMALDTMCSSSLTAIHLACQSLQKGGCELAIAGGVNVSIHPNKYLLLGQGKFVSSMGRCESFGEGGDGYVPGEGVGAVLLKPLQQAVADGDHIYGVIKASAVNHGGKTNGYTVPNPNAQAKVILQTFKAAGIDPRTLSYIEAHGTGTSLGDPIEITGLTKAFREYTQDNQFCAIGSAKSNIGHCESAAGIAGVTKLLLQLQNKQIAPSLHSAVLNPNIDFSATPFIVQQNLTEWKRPVVVSNGATQEYPRRAGVSSFGAGGSNAHILIEEYIPQERDVAPIASSTWNPAIIVLSAKSEEQLKRLAQRFITAIQEQQITDHNLADTAYTLQVGRDAMEERLALTVESVGELEEKLRSFVDGRADMDALYRGQVKRNKETLAVFTADEDLQQAIEAWVAKGKYMKLLELWVQGLNFDWNKLYGDSKPRRISLPTYPFAKQRYWVPEIPVVDSLAVVPTTTNNLHPLLHQNTSDFAAQRFSSTFSGREFFIAEHRVQAQPVLPGVAYLEMARAAIGEATGFLDEGQYYLRLKNVVWVRPVAVGEQPVQLQIRLVPEDQGDIRYEVYSDPESVGGEPVIYCQGSGELRPISESITLDIRDLQVQCNKAVYPATQCYETFKKIGIDYGLAFQVIEQLYVGSNQIFAKLVIPSSVAATLDQFVLHPSLLDAALHASIGLVISSTDHRALAGKSFLKPVMPFALQEIEIRRKCSPVMWSLVRYSEGSQAGDPVEKINVDLCNDQGEVCVRVTGMSSRVLERDLLTHDVSKPNVDEPLLGNVMLTPAWQLTPVEKRPVYPAATDRVLVIGAEAELPSMLQSYYPMAIYLENRALDTQEALAQQLNAYGPINHIVWVAPKATKVSLADATVIAGQERGVLHLFRIIKAVLELGYGAQELGWSIITTQTQAVFPQEPIQPTHASLHGLAGTLAKEYPQWKVRIVDLEAGGAWPFAEIFALAPDRQGHAWVYRGEQWYRQQLLAVQPPILAQRDLYRNGGVYVVIGGAGEIGEAWSEFMISAFQAHIIWIGRRPNDQKIQAKLERLAILGPEPLYLSADAADQTSLQSAYETIKRRYARIDGVIHAAMVFAEQSLAQLKEEQFKAVLAAKVDVSVRMAQVFGKENLDFMMFFSSMIAFIKNPHQSPYASGCAFTDAFARQLGCEWPCAVKIMNWGYWKNQALIDYGLERQLAQIGIELIEPPEAMETLTALLGGPIDQLGLMKISKPLDIEGVNPEERVVVYPERFSITLEQINQRIAQPTSPPGTMFTNELQQMQVMDGLLSRLLTTQLQSLGILDETNLAKLKKQSGLIDLYDRWLEESRAIVARNNDSQAIGDPWQEWKGHRQVWDNASNLKALVGLVEATLRSLPEILTGKRPATEIIFPNSSLELVEGIYKNNPVADYFNEALADIVVAFVEERRSQDSAARIRILEIGAGTGGTSAGVFRKLVPYQAQIEEYCYTDISKAFLLHAEREYHAQYPYLTYKIFNVELPPAGQAIDLGGYDLVIAANVLHATQNIRQTLRNLKAVLSPNGLLLLNELSCNSLFNHLTFGLLEGWWRYQDPALRIAGCPGLYPETWQRVLAQEGFPSSSFPLQAAHDLGQQIVIAASDGVVRQVRQTKTPPTRSKPQVTQPALNRRAQEPVASQSIAAKDEAGLGAKATAYFQQLIGETLKIPASQIDPAEPLDMYGVDSILAVQMVNELRKVWTDLSSTLFFEYPTIDALVAHFTKTQRDSLLKLLKLENETIPGDGETTVALSPVAAPPTALIAGRQLRPLRVPEGEVAKIPSVSAHQDIAIIALEGRYPGANDLASFWENLKNGQDAIAEIPSERWDYRQYFDLDRDQPGKTYSKWGGFLEGVEQFDPAFFKLSPREAENMDPQERLFLECVWNLLESGGYTRESLRQRYQGRVGVYAGVMYQQYYRGLSSFSGIANRVSGFFDFQGPSLAVDTACSSSAVAIHLACESLIKGECQLAIAGGVNLSLRPEKYVELAQNQMLASQIDYRSFGNGDGLHPAEGVGAVLLKPFAQALKDRDSILAVIKSTCINHSGHTNGLAPNPNAQAQLMEDNFEKSGIDPRTISYVEAAANGSALGDPLELTALNKVFRKYTTEEQFCAIGSIKSNIGHAEAASGISQLTKVVLQLLHQQRVPSIKAIPLNPEINFRKTPFYLQAELQEWQQPIIKHDGEEREVPRRATVSSFGAGGTNAHLIIEEYRQIAVEQSSSPLQNQPKIMVFSAKNQERLQAVVQAMLQFIRTKELSLNDLAYTLQIGREAMESRLALIVNTQEALIHGLQRYLDAVQAGKRQDASIPMFTGDLGEAASEMRNLLSGKVGETVVQVLLAENNLEKIAALWTQGGKIPWESFYEGQAVRRMALPTYPFAKQRYWAANAEMAIQSAEPTLQSIDQADPLATHSESSMPQKISDAITQFLAQELNMNRSHIKLNKSIQEYAMNSILIMKFIRNLERRFAIEITGRDILDHESIEALAAYLASKIPDSAPTRMVANPEAEMQSQPTRNYQDEQVIQALRKLAQGELKLNEAQKLI